MNSMNQAPDVKYMDIVDQKLLEKIDQDDRRMLDYIGRLYKAVNGETLNLDDLESAVDALATFNQRQEYNYLNNLLHPEKCKGVKLPSPIPVPSAAFQLHNSVTVSTNSSGNLGIVFNPFFLYDKSAMTRTNGLQTVTSTADFTQPGANCLLYGSNLSSFWINNDDALLGNAAGQGEWKPMNIGQGIPNVYDQYRLVSASIVIKYIGRLDIVSGVIGGAIVFDENRYIGANGLSMVVNNVSSGVTDKGQKNWTSNPALDKYSNFDLAMDSFYHQENLCLEGCRELYFPVDNTFEEYMKLTDNSTLQGTFIPSSATSSYDITKVWLQSDQDYYKSGFNYMIYVLGAPASSACFKVDIYCNFECLPNAEFLNYMPISVNPTMISPAEKAMAIKQAQNKAVQKASSENYTPGNTTRPGTMWQKLKDTFGKAIPGIAKLIGQGLINSIPAMKAAQGVIGTLISSMASQTPTPSGSSIPPTRPIPNGGG